MTSETVRSSTRVQGFEEAELDFQLLRQLGSAVYGGTSVGESLAVAAQIRATGAAGWTDAFAALGDRQRGDGDRRAAGGHAVSARDSYLRASNSYRAAEYFAELGTQRHVDLGLASRSAFRAGMANENLDFEELWIDWRGQRLPGYWFAPKGTTDRGRTFVVTSGFDGSLEETYLQVSLAALQRGWRVLQICGPGQMDVTRFEAHTHFVPDTESWVSPWIDVALARPEVDPEKLALCGISFGGYFVSRAATHEPRIRALIANSPIINLRNYLTSFVSGMGGDPETLITPEEDFSLDDIEEIPDAEMPHEVKEMARSLIRRFGQTTFLGTFKYLHEFVVDPGDITCPVLAMVGTGEGGEPIGQYETFCQKAAGPVTSYFFTQEEGADTHCQFGNLSLSAAVIFDWLDEVFG